MERANQARGHGHNLRFSWPAASVYLAAVVDWFSRRVLAWRSAASLRPVSAGLQRPVVGERHRDQHGRSRRVARQRVRRAALEVGQIRGGLSAGLATKGRAGGTRLDRAVFRPLQPQASASGVLRTHARRTKPKPDALPLEAVHDSSPPLCRIDPVRLTPLPARRRTTATHVNNRQKIHLSEAKRCSDKASHRLVRVAVHHAATARYLARPRPFRPRSVCSVRPHAIGTPAVLSGSEELHRRRSRALRNGDSFGDDR